jgi:hypothetical protein
MVVNDVYLEGHLNALGKMSGQAVSGYRQSLDLFQMRGYEFMKQ